MAIPMIVKSVLHEKAFDDGVLETRDFIQKKANLEEKRAADLAKFKEAYQEAQDAENEEEMARIQEEYSNLVYEEIAGPVYSPMKKEYVVCMDTMGQDEEISGEKRNEIELFVDYFRRGWETTEKDLLSRDIQTQVDYLNSVNAEEQISRFLDAEEAAASSKDTTGLEEAEANYEMDCARLSKVVEHLRETETKEWFFNLSKYRICKFPYLWQGLMFLLGFKKEEVDLPGTNVLNWKQVKPLIFTEEFYNKMLEYDHKGPKGPVPPEAVVTYLKQRLDRWKDEEVDNFNLGLGRVAKWFSLTVNCRINNVLIRREQKKKQRAERVQKQRDFQEREQLRTQLREKALADHQAEQEKNLEDDPDYEKVEFDMDDWERQFLEDNEEVVIPPEVQDEIDDDVGIPLEVDPIA